MDVSTSFPASMNLLDKQKIKKTDATVKKREQINVEANCIKYTRLPV